MKIGKYSQGHQINNASQSNKPNAGFDRDKNIFSCFWKYIYFDLDKRSSKPFDMFTLTELTTLPLIFCEKLCYVVSPGSGILSQSLFISTMYKLFFSNQAERLWWWCDICDFRRKGTIFKSDIKVLLFHLHMHTLPFEFQHEWEKIINGFFSKNQSMTIPSFINKSNNINGDWMYLMFLILDKYSLSNAEELEWFNQEVCNNYNNEVFHEYIMKVYKTEHVSKRALDYGSRIIHAKVDKVPFDVEGWDDDIGDNDDDDDYLDDLDNFESDWSWTLCEFNAMKVYDTTVQSTMYSGVSEWGKYQGTCVNINAMNTNYDQDMSYNSVKMKISSQNNTHNHKNNPNNEHTERINKTIELLAKNRGISIMNHFSQLESRRATSTKRTYDCPIACTRRNVGSNSMNNLRKRHRNYNEWLCFKQSKKHKGLVSAKIIHTGNYIFYFKSVGISQQVKPQTTWITNNPNVNSHMKYSTTNTTNPNGCTSSSAFNNSALNNSNHNLNNGSSNNLIHSINNSNSMTNISSNTKFILKRIILTKHWYPTIIKYPNKKYFQLQLTSSLHNTQTVINFYSLNEILLTTFTKKLSLSQHQCGRNISDIYDWGHEIGNGKFGCVSLATHRKTSKQVAIKVVSKIEAANEEVYHSNKWENDIFKFMINGSLGCDNVVKSFEFFETPNYWYYVSEYISGGNWKTFATDYLSVKNKISDTDWNNIAIQLVTGIAFLHKYGIIHRDIKHTNTWIDKIKTKTNSNSNTTSLKGPKDQIKFHTTICTQQGWLVENTNNIVVKITDFGLSKAMGYEDSTTEPYGSLSFKAPEWIMENSYSFGVDLWAWGITIYYWMYNKFPVKAMDKNTWKEKICSENYIGSMMQKGVAPSTYYSKVTFQCLVKDPAKRATAAMLLNDYK